MALNNVLCEGNPSLTSEDSHDGEVLTKRDVKKREKTAQKDINEYDSTFL